MAQLNVEKVVKELDGMSGDQPTIEKAKSIINANIKPETIDKAVLFLGLTTIILAVGSIVLIGWKGTGSAPDALWGALGTGIGGLAGIFMGKERG